MGLSRGASKGVAIVPRYLFRTASTTDFPAQSMVELPDIDAARATAVRFAGELLIHEAPPVFDAEWELQVTTAAGVLLYRINVAGYAAPAAARA